jgi:class 3 adenylate cyclase/tetratricopeptide (TPR) repeat protein/ribosomal protein L40E
MKCPKCQFENPAEMHFCGKCGAKLEKICSQCNSPNPSGFRFCGKCGHDLTQLKESLAVNYSEPQSYTPKHLTDKILASQSSLEGERKQVTVLFCDLVNSTALAERLGPEPMHALINEFFGVGLSGVHRYEGTINQFLGDGFMALFGAPIAHEDHARRAVLAAVEIQRELREKAADLARLSKERLAVRMGLNTGLVIVGAIGDDLRMDYTAVGDTTNVAARLQRAASPGQIVISDTTHSLVTGYCTTRPLGEFALKGKSEAIIAWEVISVDEARTRIEVEAERGLTPFVGRERELQILSGCFAQAREGNGQVVFLVGEAGLGKSRLVLEFRLRIGTQATWLEGHAMSFGRSMAFHPLIDLLRRNFRIEEDDPEAAIIERIEASVLRLGEEMRSILPYLRYLLAVDPGDPTVKTMDPQLRRGEIFDSLRRLMLRSAEVRPQVLVFEDLHWMDQATEDFLTFLADSIPASRVLCLFTYRPGYAHPFGDRSYHTRIALPNLSSEDTVQMAQAMLATEHLPAELETLIHKKAEGNPFFVEEVVKSLRDVGAIRRKGDRYELAKPLDEIVVPDTIQDVLMARIDRLEEAPKRTLQLASVIGREFTRRLVDRLVDIRERTEAYLQELKAIELIYEKTLFPELAYMFKHALTQDVAYHSLLEQRRKELHRIIGLAVEDLYADRLAEHYEVLGYHFAKGEEWAKALEYLCKAAEKATEAFATREAVALYDEALEAAGQLGDATGAETLMGIHAAKANLYFALSDFEGSRAEGEHLLALARRVRDQASEAGALASMGWASLWAHDFDRGLEYSRQAIEAADSADAKSPVAASQITTGLVHMLRGHLDVAQKKLDQALTISRQAGDVIHEAFSLSLAGLVKNWEGEYTEASRLLSDSLQISREHNLSVPFLQALWVKGLALVVNGEYDEALSTIKEGLALSEKLGDEVFGHRILNGLGWLYSECGDLDRAIDLSQQAAARARKRGDAETISNPELNLSDVFLAQGDLALAQEALDGVYGLVRDPATTDWMRWRFSMHLFGSFGVLWLARGEPAKARKFTEQCLEIATRTNSRKYLVKGWLLKGQIALADRQWGEAEKWLRQALTMAERIGNPTLCWKTHLAVGHLHAETKRSEMAQQAYLAARNVIDGMKASTKNPELRASLESSPMFSQIYDLTTSNL